jgi:hypothetical protein
MAWRPSQYLIEGELDNTEPEKVTGWMKFAGMAKRVTFNLRGNFHRDIRGAKIHLSGVGQSNDLEAASYMDGFALEQAGEVGDMTAGLPPADYVKYPYLEWYGDDNGRVVIELEPDQVQLVSRPIPACESDPIPRSEQARKMANFLAGLSAKTQVPAIAVGDRPTVISDPTFTHWVVAEGNVIGEAREVRPDQNGTCFAYVRLFQMPEGAEYGRIEKKYLRSKDAGPLTSMNTGDREGTGGEAP